VDFTLKENRLNSWNNYKKSIEQRININHKKDGSVKFRIKPWSIWWFDVGENIGTGTGCHFSKDKLTTLRPCIIISTNNFNNASYNKKVMIMPLTSKKEHTRVKHFHYELDSSNYKEYFDKKHKIDYVGLSKNSLVICNDIKTIDTKRLYKLMYPSLISNDIDNIKAFIRKYFGL
jgi:uncharacterized protein YifN (PemK superfamily)